MRGGARRVSELAARDTVAGSLTGKNIFGLIRQSCRFFVFFSQSEHLYPGHILATGLHFFLFLKDFGRFSVLRRVDYRARAGVSQKSRQPQLTLSANL